MLRSFAHCWHADETRPSRTTGRFYHSVELKVCLKIQTCAVNMNTAIGIHRAARKCDVRVRSQETDVRFAPIRGVEISAGTCRVSVGAGGRWHRVITDLSPSTTQIHTKYETRTKCESAFGSRLNYVIDSSKVPRVGCSHRIGPQASHQNWPIPGLSFQPGFRCSWDRNLRLHYIIHAPMCFHHDCLCDDMITVDDVFSVTGWRCVPRPILKVVHEIAWPGRWGGAMPKRRSRSRIDQ